MKNISNASKKALALSKRDQIIESFKKQKQQLDGIDAEGPKDQDDVNLVQMCVRFVLGEIYLSEIEQMEMEDNL